MHASIRYSLLAAVGLVAAVRPAAAQQQAAAAGQSHPVLSIDVATTTRAIATYHFEGWRSSGLPTEVTLADSAGTLVASYRTTRTRIARPMTVTARGTDVVLRGMTNAGPLTLELYTPSDDALGMPVVGRWTLGDQVGELRGRMQVATATPR